MKARLHFLATLAALALLTGCISAEPSDAGPPQTIVQADDIVPTTSILIYPPPALRSAYPGPYTVPGLETYPPLVIGGEP